MSASVAKNPIIKLERLPQGPMQTQDPFLFCVYHKDMYPAGDAKMQAPRRGNGADFDPDASYRMYHGDRIPGFPQHPHRGFETITATTEGTIDHTDSVGNAGRYGDGDVQWMTAGKGVVHGEMFPLVHADKPNTLKLFQIWLNLPAKSKMVEPAFAMQWANQVQKVSLNDNAASVTVWAGQLQDAVGGAPPPNSWAADEANDVAIWYIAVQPGRSATLPAARTGSAVNRAFYFVEGSKLVMSADGAKAEEGRNIPKKSYIQAHGDAAVTLHNPSDSEIAELLMLQGKPISEPVAQHGPFVMNTRAEIMQAFADYQRTQFGGWPWPEDAMVFPREKGHFAQRGFNAPEEYPPQL